MICLCAHCSLSRNFIKEHDSSNTISFQNIIMIETLFYVPIEIDDVIVELDLEERRPQSPQAAISTVLLLLYM